MYKGLIITDDEQIRKECEDIIRDSGFIFLETLKDSSDLPIKKIISYLFVLVTDFDPGLFERISTVQKQSLGLNFIFYNHSLNFSAFSHFTYSSKVKLIVGENRKTDLKQLMSNVKENYWRKLPYKDLGIRLGDLSPRMKRVMRFIESAPITDCNINSLSTYLNISAGYFSQEFKRETSKSFRSFMQDVLDYYEDLIFTHTTLAAKEISQILGYSELSSFSRSFKKRKGISPTKYKKTVNV